jgi:beta-mannosidase
MNWMFSEIWQSATWAIIDYHLEPKQAYYQMKKSFAPILLTFVQKPNGVTALTLVNDTYKAFETDVTYGLKKVSGEVVWSKTAALKLSENGVAQVDVVDVIDGENVYLFAQCAANGETLTTVYSHDMWSKCFGTSDYTYQAQPTATGLIVKIKANSFAKGVTLRLPENCGYTYSDNYFDMQAGEEKVVVISGGKVRVEDLEITDFAKETANA